MIRKLYSVALALVAALMITNAAAPARALPIDLGALGLQTTSPLLPADTGGLSIADPFLGIYSFLGSGPSLVTISGSDIFTTPSLTLDFAVGFDFYSGASVAFMSGPDAIEILFENVLDPAGLAAGSHVLASITHITDPFGPAADPFDSPFAPPSIDIAASITLTNVAAVPLPATLPLMLVGLGAFAWVRRRKYSA